MVQPVTGREKLDRGKALAWLNEQWKGNKLCPICSENSWSISEDLVEVRPYKGGALVVGGSLFPFLVVTCRNCGHTLFFNAVIAGLVEGSAE